jgi:hypothetical protein
MGPGFALGGWSRDKPESEYIRTGNSRTHNVKPTASFCLVDTIALIVSTPLGDNYLVSWSANLLKDDAWNNKINTFL